MDQFLMNLIIVINMIIRMIIIEIINAVGC
jgi:hypothetical protein